MSRRSFEAINYSLRPNKNVERKLIASSLLRLTKRFQISDYRYIGFGSMWFTDFSLFHRALNITDMVTMERDVSRTKRVEFNKPYSCIQVKMGSAASFLGELCSDKPTVVWLDYDGGLVNALDGDLEIAIGAMTVGSMIMVSVNALPDQLRGQTDDDGDAISEIDALINMTGDERLRPRQAEITKRDFPKLVAEILSDRIKASAYAKPGLEYRPIWNFLYADGADMITVGGMIVDPATAADLIACDLASVSYLMTPDPYQIKLPILTDKEKRELDRLMPTDRPVDERKLPFELRTTELAAYQRFYLEYPIYNEVAA